MPGTGGFNATEDSVPGSSALAPPTASPSHNGAAEDDEDTLNGDMQGNAGDVVANGEPSNTASSLESIYNCYVPSASAGSLPSAQIPDSTKANSEFSCGENLAPPRVLPKSQKRRQVCTPPGSFAQRPWLEPANATKVRKTEKHSEKAVGDEDQTAVRRDQEDPRPKAHQEPFTSHDEVPLGKSSAKALASDSDEDPFVYDRAPYSSFLKASREREVSVALRCAAGLSDTGSIYTEADEDRSPETLEHNRPIPPESLGPVNTPVQMVDDEAQDDNALPDVDLQDDVKLARIIAQLPAFSEQPAANEDQAVQKSDGFALVRQPETLVSDTGEWETVATSVGPDNSPRDFTPDIVLGRTFPVKIAGSSLAGYSDGESLSELPSEHPSEHPSEQFTSTLEMLPDPDPTSRQCKSLKSTLPADFPAKPRIHRVNGYLHKAARLFTDPPSGDSRKSSRTHQIMERLGASIRSRFTGEREQNRQTSDNAKPLSNFRTRDSFGWFEMEEMGGDCRESEEEARVKPNTSINRKSDCVFAETGKRFPAAPSPGDSFPNFPTRFDDSDQGRMEQPAKTLFSFQLISLEEAARRQALKIENGEDDPIFNTGVTTGNNSRIGLSSWRQTGRTTLLTPPTPSITKPRPAHCRPGHSRHPTSVGLPTAAPPPAQPTIFPPTTAPLFTQNKILQPTTTSPPTHTKTERSTTNLSPTSPRIGIPTTILPSIQRRIVMVPSEEMFSNPCIPPPTQDGPTISRSSLRSTLSLANVPVLPDRAWTTPRLYPKPRRNYNYRHQSNNPGQAHGINWDDDPHGDDYLSPEARQQRWVYFFFMCGLLILPFFFPLIYRGVLDPLLVYLTHGEAERLSRKQRKIILVLGSVISVAYVCFLTFMITLAALHKY
jgi:hypothetical protein